MDDGWSDWDTTGNRRVRFFTDAEGVVRFYQWNNERGFCTVNRDVRSARISSAVVAQAQLELNTIPRSATTGHAEQPSSLTRAKLEPVSSNQSEDRSFELTSLSAARSTELAPSEAAESQVEGLTALSKDIRDAGLEQNGKQIGWHIKNADMLDITSQNSVRFLQQLPEGFKQRNKKWFQRGRVFKTIFPTAGGQNTITDSELPQGTVYVTLRPVIVIHSDYGHCLCIPIFSYGGTGLREKNFTTRQKSNHAVVHVRGTPATSDPSEGMTHEPFRVFPAQNQTLTAMSRIRFDMWHTVQYNTLVQNMGMIDRDQTNRLINCAKAAIF